MTAAPCFTALFGCPSGLLCLCSDCCARGFGACLDLSLPQGPAANVRELQVEEDSGSFGRLTVQCHLPLPGLVRK